MRKGLPFSVGAEEETWYKLGLWKPMKKFVVQIGFFFFTDVSSVEPSLYFLYTSHPGLALSFPGNRTVVRFSGQAPQMYGCRGDDVGVTGTVEGRSRGGEGWWWRRGLFKG